MQIKKIEIKEKFSKFKNTSDKYTDIYLSREIKEISRISYNNQNFYLNIGEDGKINTIEVINVKCNKSNDNFKIPEKILKGEVLFEELWYDNKDTEYCIEGREIEDLYMECSNTRLDCFFDENKNFNYGVQISEEIIILVGENNIMKGILINGNFKNENGRFYNRK